MLAAFAHPGHIVIYVPGDSLSCRCAAMRVIEGILSLIKPAQTPWRCPDPDQYTSSPDQTARLCAPSG
ncbi:hypothetical protein EA114_17845 [Salmonella enterica subsp. enterica serovar 6,7:b:-]|nr:hypothetical protein [Salmonella enterica]EBH8903808.1 hypothetical protein [Salmonella enterica subsp. enterica serovar 6,7:b:-]EBH8946281.1 hypothetical protein [Salmonella enterica subsp. enterica serovar 6,7:b:-]MMQ68160.1 hypothetical protein [Salmonella enterica subsp. enterica serovar 6,7:b:-]